MHRKRKIKMRWEACVQVGTENQLAAVKDTEFPIKVAESLHVVQSKLPYIDKTSTRLVCHQWWHQPNRLHMATSRSVKWRLSSTKEGHVVPGNRASGIRESSRCVACARTAICWNISTTSLRDWRWSRLALGFFSCYFLPRYESH